MLLENSLVLRFEPSEYELLNCTDANRIQIIIAQLLKANSIDMLLIPHLGYKPFHDLAESANIKSISFYQESIQLPKSLLIERESRLLLNPQNGTNSLYTSKNRAINRKISGQQKIQPFDSQKREQEVKE